jgi:hypothetical protein
MRPIVVTVGPLASASANNIATTATPVSGTALTLNGSLVTGGVAILDTPRRILLTFGNEASNRTMVLTGTNWAGDTISETLTVASGAGGTVASVLDYAKLTSALPLGGGWTAAVTLGTNGVAASPWVRLNEWARPAIGLQLNATGTVNYTVQVSYDDPNSRANPVTPSAMVWSGTLVGGTVDALSSLTEVALFVRTLLNSGSGSVATTVVQYGG